MQKSKTAKNCKCKLADLQRDVVVSYFIQSFIHLENSFSKSDDEVGQLSLADAVTVLQLAALAWTVAFFSFVVYHIAI